MQAPVQNHQPKEIIENPPLTRAHFGSAAEWIALGAIALNLTGCGLREPRQEAANLYRFPAKSFPEQLANFVRTNSNERVLTVAAGNRCSYGHVLNYLVFTGQKESTESTHFNSAPQLTPGANYYGNGIVTVGWSQGTSADNNLVTFMKANQEAAVRASVFNGYPWRTAQYTLVLNP
jgi:hypothetical protein